MLQSGKSAGVSYFSQARDTIPTTSAKKKNSSQLRNMNGLYSAERTRRVREAELWRQPQACEYSASCQFQPPTRKTSAAQFSELCVASHTGGHARSASERSERCPSSERSERCVLEPASKQLGGCELASNFSFSFSLIEEYM